VDTEGNQLPYIDKVVVEYTANLDVVNLKTLSGALHVAGTDLMIMNYPVLKPGEKQGDYTVRLVNSERGADVALAFNTNHQDPVLKKIFNDVRFRQACSLAINRTEINELAFLGQGTPRAATVNESASFFNKAWADAYIQFDAAAAGKLLDAVGLDKKGSDGIRLRPDGKPMAFTTVRRRSWVRAATRSSSTARAGTTGSTQAASRASSPRRRRRTCSTPTTRGSRRRWAPQSTRRRRSRSMI
jgi:peptide/nickel transport system substrate-binding protein